MPSALPHRSSITLPLPVSLSMLRHKMTSYNEGMEGALLQEDNSSPYYLHLSDSPRIAASFSQVLIGSNYLNWSRSVDTALLAKNKLLFVNGGLLRPDEDHLLFPQWIRCNSMVVSWLRNSVLPHICSSVMYLGNANEIWTDLHDCFSQSDSARSYQLRQQIMNLNQVHGGGRLLKRKLTRCNSSSVSILHSLKSDLTSSLPSLSKTFSLVVQEERQRSLDHNFGSTPHSASEQLFAVNAASSSYGRGRLCTHCGKNNHTVDSCFVLHGFPPSFGRGRGKPMSKDSIQPKSVNLVDDNLLIMVIRPPQMWLEIPPLQQAL
ncbi:uncharacterized protein LOC125209603 [Salvia hispanica]|uniref:uncharacterized protein LOC125209603 n=1 Tax=Salvia hispanica TaxID=49212 RepID=UPI002009B7FA|nr:uncharacterized protein LOC125209603 [Salvia hispanica]